MHASTDSLRHHETQSFPWQGGARTCDLFCLRIEERKNIHINWLKHKNLFCCFFLMTQKNAKNKKSGLHVTCFGFDLERLASHVTRQWITKAAISSLCKQAKHTKKFNFYKLYFLYFNLKFVVLWWRLSGEVLNWDDAIRSGQWFLA